MFSINSTNQLMPLSRKTITRLAAFALLLAGASGAAAGTKVLPATMCVQEGTTSTVEYTGFGTVANPTSSPIKVICPIVRDHTDTKWNSMEVVVLDLNGGSGESNNVICQARSNDATGGPLSKVS